MGPVRRRGAAPRRRPEARRRGGFLRARVQPPPRPPNPDWFRGRWEGLADRSAALAEANADRPAIRLAGIRLIARLAAAAGRRREAEEHFRFVLDEATRLGAADDAMEPAAELARLWRADGDLARALQITDAPLRTIREKGIWLWATDVAPVRVEALSAAGEADAARALTEEFARGLRGHTAPAPRAALALCRGHVAAASDDSADAASAYARAAHAWDGLPRPYDALRARERQAVALLAAGRVLEGRRLLSAQYEELFRLGARGDADRVAQRLRQDGADGAPALARRPEGGMETGSRPVSGRWSGWW